MKQLILPITLSFIIASSCYAENIQEEAMDSLATAKTFVEKGNYNKAIEEINYALAKINELTAEGLIKFIPEPPPGYTLDNKQSKVQEQELQLQETQVPVPIIQTLTVLLSI